jgi:hypothetical protein
VRRNKIENFKLEKCEIVQNETHVKTRYCRRSLHELKHVFFLGLALLGADFVHLLDEVRGSELDGSLLFWWGWNRLFIRPACKLLDL